MVQSLDILEWKWYSMTLDFVVGFQQFKNLITYGLSWTG